MGTAASLCKVIVELLCYDVRVMIFCNVAILVMLLQFGYNVAAVVVAMLLCFAMLVPLPCCSTNVLWIACAVLLCPKLA